MGKNEQGTTQTITREGKKKGRPRKVASIFSPLDNRVALNPEYPCIVGVRVGDKDYTCDCTDAYEESGSLTVIWKKNNFLKTQKIHIANDISWWKIKHVTQEVVRLPVEMTNGQDDTIEEQGNYDPSKHRKEAEEDFRELARTKLSDVRKTKKRRASDDIAKPIEIPVDEVIPAGVLSD